MRSWMTMVVFSHCVVWALPSVILATDMVGARKGQLDILLDHPQLLPGALITLTCPALCCFHLKSARILVELTLIAELTLLRYISGAHNPYVFLSSAFHFERNRTGSMSEKLTMVFSSTQCIIPTVCISLTSLLSDHTSPGWAPKAELEQLGHGMAEATPLGLATTQSGITNTQGMLAFVTFVISLRPELASSVHVYGRGNGEHN